MVSPHGVDSDKLKELLAHKNADQGYSQWLDAFVIPLLKRVGLKVKVTRTSEYTTLKIAVKRPIGEKRSG